MVNFIIERILTRSKKISNWMFQALLLGVHVALRIKGLLLPEFRQRLKERSMTAQIKVRGDLYGRTFTFRDGRVSSKNCAKGAADVAIVFKDAAAAVQLMSNPGDMLKQINAMKNFVVDAEGKDADVIWFMQTLKMLQRLHAEPRCGTRGQTIRPAMSATPTADRYLSTSERDESFGLPPSILMKKTPSPGPSRPAAGSLPRPARPP